MYVTKPPDYPSILNIAGVDMTPKLINYKKTVDHNGKINEIIEALIYARIDSEIFKSFTQANISEGYKPESIEIRLSSKNIDSYRGKSGQTSVRSRSRSTSTARRSNLNSASRNAGASKKNKTKNIYSDTILLGRISIAAALMDVERQEDNNKSKVYRVENGKKVSENVAQLQNLVAGSFKKIYTSMIELNRDPVSLFQNSYGKISEGNRKAGRKNKTRTLMSEEDAKSFLPVYKNITSIIRGTAGGVRNLEIKKSYEEIRYVKINLKTRINLKKLEALGEEIHVLMIVKNKKGIKLNAESYSFLISNILKQKTIEGSEYNIKSSRLNTGTSLVSISNERYNKRLSLNLHAKKIKRSVPFEYSKFNYYDNIVLNGKENIKVKDGKTSAKGNYRTNFKLSESIFYRTTLNFDDKNYLNCQSTVDKSRKYKQENIPFCTVTAKQNKTNNSMSIFVSNISENVSKVVVKKYRYKGNSKGELIKTIDSFGRENSFKNAKESLDSVTFYDYDIYRTKKYMYVVECIMKNGESKMASSFFIIDYEERTNAVQITDININSSPAGLSDSIDEDEIRPKRNVNIFFKINKIQTEIDKVLENMFGDLFEIFKQDLTEIKDVQGLVYSIQIDRINRDTGENETIGKVTADKEGNCRFVDNHCPALDDVTYKLIPRVSLGVDLIDKINSTIELLGQKTIFNAINYSGASNKRKVYRRSNNIYNSKNNKFTKRNAFLKGLIETPEFTVNTENLDIFFNNQTGDIEYIDLGSEETLTHSRDISILNSTLQRVNNGAVSTSNTLSQLEESFYDITFETNSSLYFVDFFAVFIKENNNVYLDGAMHVTDTFSKNKTFSYLVKHEGSVGSIQYYIVPFYKDGIIGSPLPVVSQIIR